MAPIDDALNGTLDRIVREACLPGDHARDDLRRELVSYFDEAEAADDSPDESMARFGSPAQIAHNFQQVYRGTFLLWLTARICIAIILAVVISEVLLALTHLRFSSEHSLYLSPRFFRAYGFGIKVALGLAAAWEMGRRPFRLKRALGALAAYGLVITVLQAYVFNGLRGWEPWHTPSLITLGFLASRVRPTALRLAVMFGGFLAYGIATSSQGAASRMALAMALVVIWTLAEWLFAALDQGLGARFEMPMASAFIRERGRKTGGRRPRSDNERGLASEARGLRA